jgi:hypothetical protein
MKAQEFKRLTGYTMKEWSDLTERSYYNVTDEIYRGYCNLVKHGAGRSHPLWDTWSSMKTRCYNPNSKSYSRYGQRGIRMCAEWFYSFDEFIKDMYSTYDPTLTLDRIDNEGDYTPTNCRWASIITQTLNSSTVKGCPGVHFCTTTQRWIFRLRKEGKLVYTKTYTSRLEAEEHALNTYSKEGMLEHYNKTYEVLYE